MRSTLVITITAMLMGISSMVYAQPNPIQHSVQTWMETHFPVENSRWKVTILSFDQPLQDEKITSCEVAGLVGLKKPKKIMIFKVVPKVGNTLVKRQITARVSRMVKVPIANEVIRKGVTIEKNAWHLEERSVDLITKDAILDPAALSGKRTKKVISSQEVLTWHAVEKIPDVLLGQALVLRVIGDGVILSTDAVSLEEGNIQEWIQVKQKQNGQAVKAMVMGPGEAQIQLARRK